MSAPEPDNPNWLLATGMAMALAASGRSRQDVAAAAGVSTTHVTKLLMGKVNPSQKVLVDLADAVGHTIAEIYSLGSEARERESQRRRREATRKAQDEKTAEAVVEMAGLLGRDELREVIRQLQRMEEKLVDQEMELSA